MERGIRNRTFAAQSKYCVRIYLEGLNINTNLTVSTAGVSTESQTEHAHVQIWNVTTWRLELGVVACRLVTLLFAITLSRLVQGLSGGCRRLFLRKLK
jgi:hypothetical protein